MHYETLTIRRAYKFRLYRCDKHDGALHHRINVAGKIWNHALALYKRYYRLARKYISLGVMKAHIAKLRMRTARYVYWKALGSQAVQDVLERLDAAFQRFFAKQGQLPRFKAVKRYKSFTLKQAGWKLLYYNQNKLKPNNKYGRSRGIVEIDGTAYKFVQHRPMFGIVKTVTVKRDAVGHLWVCFSVREQIALPVDADLSHIGGFDFGLREFLTDHTGKRWMPPLFFRDVLKRVQQLNRDLSHKVDGSNNRARTKKLLARAHQRVADKRRDFHFKLANALCETFDVLVFEDLNIAAMKRLWGRKVSDLGFGKFLAILKHIATLRGKVVLQIGRFEPTTQPCSRCGKKQTLTLKQRQFDCPHCGLSLDRDHNAALNIQRLGTLCAGASARPG
jgi:putative transposase